MTIKTIVQKYETSDGRKFTDEAEAARHQALITAKDEYESARHKWVRALTATYKTADGQNFSLTKHGDYWRIANYFHDNALPTLERVSFWVWHCDINEADHAVIIERKGEHTRHYRISELYASERNAKIALLAAQEKELQYMTEQVQKLRDEIGGE